MVPKSLAPSTGAGLPSSSVSAAGSMPQASQCVNVPTGASGSSTISASERLPSGTFDQTSAGERSSASQVLRAGISPPCWKAGLVSDRAIVDGLPGLGAIYLD